MINSGNNIIYVYIILYYKMGYNYKAVTGSTKISNRPAWMVGGSGLGIGGPPSARRAQQIRANGQGINRNKTFIINQLGGIGRMQSMFISNADGINNNFNFKIKL